MKFRLLRSWFSSAIHVESSSSFFTPSSSSSGLALNRQMPPPWGPAMEKTCNCKGCGALLNADYRNAQRQRFCRRKGCQKLRRSLRQRLRRQGQRSALVPSKRPGAKPKQARRPQRASLISPPDIHAENPVIIGLISMVTGSTHLEEIEATYRQLWIRGKQIMEGAEPREAGNSPLINIFHALEQSAERGG